MCNTARNGNNEYLLASKYLQRNTQYILRYKINMGILAIFHVQYCLLLFSRVASLLSCLLYFALQREESRFRASFHALALSLSLIAAHRKPHLNWSIEYYLSSNNMRWTYQWSWINGKAKKRNEQQKQQQQALRIKYNQCVPFSRNSRQTRKALMLNNERTNGKMKGEK